MPTAFLYVFAAVFGLIMGSFLNVVVMRDKERRSILTGRSKCAHCGHILRWYELIPLISFVIQAGKCRECRTRLSWQYPAFEILTAILAVATTYYAFIIHHNFSLLIFLGLAFSLFLVVSAIDILTLEIPIEYLLGGAVIGGLAMLFSHTLGFTDLFLGVVVGAGSLAVISYGWKALFKQEGMGVGDIWVGGAMGAVCGYPLIVVCLMAAVFSGAILGILALGLNRKSMETALPFGPFLFLGLLIALIWGQTVLQWYIL